MPPLTNTKREEGYVPTKPLEGREEERRYSTQLLRTNLEREEGVVPTDVPRKEGRSRGGIVAASHLS